MDQVKKTIILTGYPKSGTTWATRVIGHLIDCPIIGYWGYQNDTFVTEGKERESEYICYQSHHSYDELLGSEWGEIDKIICIVRDPRDIVVSGAYHYIFLHKYQLRLKQLINKTPWKESIIEVMSNSISHEKKLQLMANCVLKGDINFKGCELSWKNHVQSFLQNKIHVFRYEDLLHNSIETCQTILDALSINKDIKHIEHVVDEQGFSKKKKEFKTQNETIKFKHLRKGKTAEWKKELSCSLTHEIESEVINLLNKFNYQISNK